MLLKCGSDTLNLKTERKPSPNYSPNTEADYSLPVSKYSAYIMDERFPSVPMLKWDHMMQSPPMFCHVVPGTCSTKVLLGSHSSQEVTLLQYSGQSTVVA